MKEQNKTIDPADIRLDILTGIPESECTVSHGRIASANELAASLRERFSRFVKK